MENLDVDAGITYLDTEPSGRASTEPLYRGHPLPVCSRQSKFAARDTVGLQEL